jgi:hypothetical protein
MTTRLLTIETVIRETCAQHGSDRLLGAHVRLGHGRAVGLERDREIAPVEALDDLRGRVRGFERCLKFRRHVLSQAGSSRYGQ